jgi:hypothetical protein
MMTAVEWFELELKDKLGEIVINQNWKLLENIIKQAVEMEREQICKFASDYVETQCNASFDGSVSVDITTEEYYNLTFKSE